MLFNRKGIDREEAKNMVDMVAKYDPWLASRLI
jgi:hypothetical protein